MRIYLVGYMGSGKSFLGSRIAALMDFTFVDTDAVIESEQGSPVSVIFERLGETAFRKMEQDVLERTTAMDRVVVATGGGLPCQYDNMKRMNEIGLTVYLRVRPTTVLERTGNEIEKRPLLQGIGLDRLSDHVISHIAGRAAFYQQAMLTVDADELTAEALLGKIITFTGQSK